MTWNASGGDHSWTNEAHLLALVADAIQFGNWQRVGDENATKPKPIPRPSAVAEQDAKTTRMFDKARRFRDRTTRTETPDG